MHNDFDNSTVRVKITIVDKASTVFEIEGNKLQKFYFVYQVDTKTECPVRSLPCQSYGCWTLTVPLRGRLD